MWLTWVCLEFGHPEVKSIIALNVSIRFEVYTNSLTHPFYAPLLQPYPTILHSGGVLTFFDVGDNGAFSTKNRPRKGGFGRSILGTFLADFCFVSVFAKGQSNEI